MNSHDLDPDPELNEEQAISVDKLTPVQVDHIDEVLLSNTAGTWRKIARVVGSSMIELQNQYQDIPDIYFAQRVRKMVLNGTLDSQGSIDRMRYSEVRRVR